MADKRISQLIERTDIANNDVLPIVASGATTTNKVTISTIQTWMQDNLDVGVTSVGLSMPSAFVVSNSPVTASGNITVTGAGTVAQYIRGDGSLADFPTGGGGGSSVSYYLNGSVSQGTIGGIAYLEMNKTPILGAGTDFTINADGYIASFITDAGDPGLLEIPAGNWNFETYIQASSGGGSPTFYIELYKVNSGGTATLIASNSGTPESISLGTNINPYFSALAVPQTTLALTDRIALRYYVTHAGRTITLHTENNTLCQIITTFTTGLTALNGLTAQVQNFATGTSGTDFNISSAGSTHTFNIPSASATARGLVTTGSQTIAGAKTFSSDASFNLVSIGRGAGNQVSNTRVGDGALNANTTGTSNTAVGKLALLNNTTGSDNTSMGLDSMVSNTTGNNNVAFGSNALRSNNSNANTGIGFYALYSNTTGNNNVAVGSYSLYSNTTATGNTSSGYYSLFSNTTGGANTATGYVALSANTTGNANTATGAYALENNTTGGSNTAVGYEALETNTTGGFNTALGLGSLKLNTTGGQNTVGGTYALYSNTTGSDNTAFGVNSMYKNTTGNSNTSSGITSLFGNTTGTANVAIGTGAGTYIADGSTENSITNNSIYIGSLTKALGNNQTNQIVIGHNAIGNGSNTVTIGNDSITSNIFSGNLSTRRAVGTASEGIIELRPNTGSSNIIIASGAVPLHILSTSGSLGLGVGSTPQVTIASGGAVTLTGALTGTSATFAGRARFQGTGYDTLGSAEIMLTNTTASTGRSFIVNSSNAGEFLISDVSAGQTRLSINSSGAVTITGNLTANSFIKTGGTSSQFLKADGSVDSSTYLTTGTAASTYLPLIGGVLTGGLGGTSASFSGDVQTSTRLVAANPSATITITPNLSGTTNRIEASNLPLEVYTSGSELKFRAGTGNAQVTLASTGAVTLTGALSGTSASFTGAVTSTGAKSQFIANGGDSAGAGISLNNTLTTNPTLRRNWGIFTEDQIEGDFAIKCSTSAGGNANTGNRYFFMTSTGAATFSSSVTAGVITGDSNSTGVPSIVAKVGSGGNSGTYGFGNSSAYRIRGGSDYGKMIFDAGSADQMVLTSAGNVGIGTTPATWSTGTSLEIGSTGNLALHNSNSIGNLIAFNTYYNGDWYRKTTSVSLGYIQDSEGHKFYFNGSGGANTTFSPTERMRITSGGFLKASNTGSYAAITSSYHELISNSSGNQIANFWNTSSNPFGLYLRFTAVAPNNGINYYIYCDDNSVSPRFAVYSNGGIANFQANNTNLSDERTKKDIEPLESYWDKFKEIEIVKFKYKDQTHDDFNIGVIAQQVESVAPEFVDVDGWDTKPKVDEEGNEIVSEEEPLKSIYTADLYHASIKVLQEAMAKIEKLEAEIEALKSQING